MYLKSLKYCTVSTNGWSLYRDYPVCVFANVCVVISRPFYCEIYASISI